MEGSEKCGTGKQDHSNKIMVSQVVPILKLQANRGDPTRLRLRINPPVKVREQDYNQRFKTLPPSKSPNNSYPSVPKKNKHKHPIT